MNTGIRKVFIISELKFINIFKSPQLLSSLFLAIGFCWLMAEYMPKEQLKAQPLFIVTTGLIFSMAMAGVIITALPLAADKENHMLRVLMLSSISPLSYLIGSLLPPLLLVLITNGIIGYFWLPGAISYSLFLAISTFGTLISLMIGLVIGFYSPNQMVASSLSVPVVFFFTLIPILSTMSKDFEKFNDFLYTSQILSFLQNLYNKKTSSLTFDIVITLSITFVATLAACMYGYRKNKFD